MAKYVYTVFLAAAAVLSGCRGGVEIADMKCEYSGTPLGIDIQNPRFTWGYEAKRGGNGFSQAGFRLNIAADPALLPDAVMAGAGAASAAGGRAADAAGTVTASADATGAVTANATSAGAAEGVWSMDADSQAALAEYSGPALEPHKWYYWNVEVRGEDGRKTLSPTARFRTAKMSRNDWQAIWISDAHDMGYGPAPMFRRSFGARSGLSEAYLYISAAAYYSAAINGENVTADRLSPAYTHYDKRNLYAVHDVMNLVRNGENVITAVLGNGFYNEDAPVATWDFEQARWRGRPRMICELHLEYADGSREVIASDGRWKTTADGPYVYNNIYSGDTYDARREIDGWDRPGFDDGAWAAAVPVDAPSPVLASQMAPPIRAVRRIEPVGMRSWGDTLFVFDFGVNMAGVCELKVSGETGTRVEFRHGELLKDDGRVQMGNLDIYYTPLPGLEFQTDVYILKGGGVESWTPMFTYHGFQYVEVRSDRPITLGSDGLTACFVHTDVEPAGSFECSNELLNKIWAATNQSYLSNLHGIPTDCPQREKNGWTADGWVAMDIALMNFDGIRLYEKWLDDFADNQREDGRISGIIPSSGWGYEDWIGPVWDAALFIVPDMIERYYGDGRCIERIYPVCERYLDYLATREEPDGTVTYGIGDWVYYEAQTPTDFTSSCFYLLDNRLMAEFAAKTGRDGSRYAAKAADLERVINAKYFDAAGALYANGTQTAQATALWMGIVPAGYEQRVAANLNDMIAANGYYLDFGVLGSKFVPRMLARYGYADTAYRMASKEDAPSWGGWISQGFTTLAERWVPDLVNFRDSSLNHVFLGDISAWMYQALAGINADPDERGFRRLIFEPHFPEGLDWVKAEYRSPAGKTSASWRRRGDRVVYEITVPVNATAQVRIGDRIYETGAGKHIFRVKAD